MERRQDSPFHKKQYHGHYDYKTDLVKKLEQNYQEFQFQLYQCYVKRYNINHRFCRNALMNMKKLCHEIRKEIQEHRQDILPMKDRIHPSWQGIDDE